jgi:AcrR family transcriptional regulator
MGASSPPTADRSQPRRATFQRARSRETRRTLVRSAVALWRVKGYEETTVEDICRAAGVSKGLFYFYFQRKEDVLFEIGVLSSEAIVREARAELDRGYELMELVRNVLVSLERSMRRNPRPLVLAAILEGYRHVPDRSASDAVPATFSAVLQHAHHDGQLPPDADAARLAQVVQTLISEGVRDWALGLTDGPAFVDEVTWRIGLVVAGASRD